MPIFRSWQWVLRLDFSGKTNSELDLLHMYSIVSEEEEPVLIWSCDQVPGAYGVAVDERGLIYVSRIKNKTLYILSAEGKYNTIKNYNNYLCCFDYDLSSRFYYGM